MSASQPDPVAEFVRAMEPVARELLGEPNQALSSKEELRFGGRGSMSVRLDAGTWYDNEAGQGGGVLDLVQQRRHLDKPGAVAWMREHGHLQPPAKPSHSRQVATYDYHDETGDLLFQVVRFEPKDFRQRRPDGNGGWTWKTAGVRKVLFRLPAVLEAVAAGRIIYVVEGEKAALALAAIGLDATCSPGGAGKWRADYNAALAGADVVILPDNDPQAVDKVTGHPRWHPDGRPVLPGQDHAAEVAGNLVGVAARVRVLTLPGLSEKGDVVDWLAAGGTWEGLETLAEDAPDGAEWAATHLTGPATEAEQDEPARSRDRANEPPAIKVVNGELSDAVTRGEQALIRAKLGIYQRGTFIVRPGIVKIAVSDERQVDGQQILVVGETGLMEALTTASPWEVYDGRANAWVRKDCPAKVVKALRDRAGHWRLPVLTGIINAPTLRPDGSILDKPGYDEASGLLFDPLGAEFGPVPVNPTKADALAALSFVDDLISTFPFIGAADRSVALSTFLTASIRRTLPTAPLHGFSAPVPGSGKSMLVDLPSIMVTGREAAVIGHGGSEVEFAKRLGSQLLAGDAQISIDNVEEPLGGELLCMALTQTKVRVRILGVSDTPELPTNALVTATGNNLTLYGDVTRRALLANLDPKCERPELRIFDRDVIEVMKAERGRYLVACLTVLRAYHLVGRPKQRNALGSFVTWSRWVRDALIWLDQADPVDTMEVMRDADPKLIALKSVVSQWHEVIGTERVSVKTLIERATASKTDAWGKPVFTYPDFREALLVVAGAGGAVNSERLGKWLREHKDRVVSKLRLTKVGVTHGMTTWQLFPAPL